MQIFKWFLPHGIIKKAGAKKMLLLSSMFFLFSCGGGGGSGGDQSSASGSNAAPTGIRIINAALDYPAMQLRAGQAASADAGTLSTAKFSEVVVHGAAPTGSLNLTVTTAANPLAVLWNGGTELNKNQHKSILVYRGFADKDLAFTVLNDAGVNIAEGQAALRVINGVTNSGSLSAAAVGFPTTGAASLGTSSEYSFFPAGTYDFAISSENSVIGRVSASLESQKSYSLVSYGAAGYFVTSNILLD